MCTQNFVDHTQWLHSKGWLSPGILLNFCKKNCIWPPPSLEFFRKFIKISENKGVLLLCSKLSCNKQTFLISGKILVFLTVLPGVTLHSQHLGSLWTFTGKYLESWLWCVLIDRDFHWQTQELFERKLCGSKVCQLPADLLSSHPTPPIYQHQSNSIDPGTTTSVQMKRA